MEREQAIDALVSLPATARVTVARLRPTDVIVIECEERLTDNGRRGIIDSAARAWPEHKCVVLDAGLKLRIASEAQ